MSKQFSSIRTIDRTQAVASTPSQSGLGSDSSEGVLCIPQSSSITGTSTSDYLGSYPRHSLVGGITPLQRSSRSILQKKFGLFYSPSRLGRKFLGRLM